MTTPSSRFLSLRTTSTSKAAILGAVAGVAAGVVIAAGTWLSPLAAADRPVLALVAVTFALPLGAMLAARPLSLPHAGAIGLSAALAGLMLATTVCVFEPALWLRTASWCVAAALIGASAGTLVRGGGLAATAFWLLLCGLPFFYPNLPILSETAGAWAQQGCPWLGFSTDALGGDPLRLSVIYLGKWTDLSAQSVPDVLDVSTLWLVAALLLAATLITAANPVRPVTAEPVQT